MKHTAIEWLVQEMLDRKFFASDTPLSYTTLEHLVNEAKEIEKEQNSEVTRFEVIDETGRAYSKWNCKIELSYQDEGRTLKVFIEK